MRSLLFYISIVLVTFAALSQRGNVPKVEKRVVKGLVLEAKTSEPLVAATVINKARKCGTLTDFDGNFCIEAEKEDSLTVSFYGYVTQRLKADKNYYEIVLESDTSIVIDWTSPKVLSEDLNPKMPQPQTKSSPLRPIQTPSIPSREYLVVDGELKEVHGLFRIRDIFYTNDYDAKIIIADMIEDIKPEDVKDYKFLNSKQASELFGVDIDKNAALLVITTHQEEKRQ